MDPLVIKAEVCITGTYQKAKPLGQTCWSIFRFSFVFFLFFFFYYCTAINSGNSFFTTNALSTLYIYYSCSCRITGGICEQVANRFAVLEGMQGSILDPDKNKLF